MALSLDPNGSSTGFIGSSTAASVTVTISTTNSNNVIICDVSDGGASFSTATVTSPHLTWTQHLQFAWPITSTSNTTQRWYAIAASPLTSEVITVSGLAANFANVGVISVSGANTSSPFDSGGPVTLGPTVQNLTSASITTTNANTLVLGGIMANTSIQFPTQGAGYTQLGAGVLSFCVMQYAIVSSAGVQTIPWGSGSGQGSSAIVDAIVAASGGASSFPQLLVLGVG